MDDSGAVDGGEGDATSKISWWIRRRGRRVRETYKPPRQKIAMVWSFCRLAMCKFHNRGKGKINMAKSVATLKTPKIVAASWALMHLPLIAGFHIAWIGTH